MLQNDPWQFMAGIGKLLQHGLGGRWRPLGGLLHYRQALLGEENIADLLGGAQVKGPPGHGMGRLLQGGDPFGQVAALRGQAFPVDAHSLALHAREHRYQGYLDVAVEVGQARHLL